MTDSQILPKRSPFYPLLPGLGKRAAMLFLRMGGGKAAAIGGVVGVAVRSVSA